MTIDEIRVELIKDRQKEHAFTSYLPLMITVAVKPDSYLHIGATGSPLSEKKGPVFTIRGRPAVPATSLKGAWRAQLETLIDHNFDALARTFGVSPQDRFLWMPCIPSPANGVTQAEKNEFQGKRKLASCQVEIQQQALQINGRIKDRDNPRKNDLAICPVCYFFGANGLPGFLRVPNLMLPSAVVESGLFDQTRTRRVRGGADSVAPGALVTLDQVDPGTTFVGEAELTTENGQLSFGKPRELGKYYDKEKNEEKDQGDLWLANIEGMKLDELRVLLLKHLLVPALLNVRVLGGMRSMKAGNVGVQFEI
jgi:CRISPR/Cas system CSM-associated protein Csm3 (group 7 of RAMP superfamily)